MLSVFTRKKILAVEMQKELSLLNNWITQNCSPLNVILFGSLARDMFTDGSDIDIALIFATEFEVKEAKKNIFKSRRPISWPLDLLFYTQEEFNKKKNIGGVCQVIQEEGRSIYEKSKLK